MFAKFKFLCGVYVQSIEVQNFIEGPLPLCFGLAFGDRGGR